LPNGASLRRRRAIVAVAVNVNVNDHVKRAYAVSLV
jgi:hypothetical protein